MMNMNNQKPKIYIITRRAGFNFGSSLQAYAIQRIVEKLGYQNFILNYDEYSKRLLWRVRPLIEDLTYCFMRFFSRLSYYFFKNKFIQLSQRNKQIIKFREFERKYLKLTPKVYRRSQMLSSVAIDCDICICGSDQIWSPLLFDPSMFLDFCKDSPIKTVAYAPSFGVKKIERYRDEIGDLIRGIDIISVRENEGSEIVRELTGRNAQVVLDPTLLLDSQDWRNVFPISKEHSQPYILCYFLGRDRIPYRFLDELRKESGCHLLNVGTFRMRNNILGSQDWTMSPDEFVGAVANAKYVCTDSFHGTIFSILFERQFFTFERFGEEPTGQNSRIHTLLNLHQLADRLIELDQGFNRFTPLINYKEVNAALQFTRKQSIQFLVDALRCRKSTQG